MNPLLGGIGLGSMLLGGLLGSKERPMLDPRMLDQLFGADALSKKTNQLYRFLAASPFMSQALNRAAMRGANLRNAAGAHIARMGLGGTPYAGFLNAAGRGYAGSLQGEAKQNLFIQALQQAAQMNQGQMGAYVDSFMQRQRTPRFGQQLGGSLLAGGSGALFNAFNPGK